MSSSNGLSNYETDQVTAIRAWKSERPGVVSQAIGFVTYPATWLIQKIIPAAAIRGALDAANWAAYWLSDTRDILRDGGVQEVSGLKSRSLEVKTNSPTVSTTGLSAWESRKAGRAELPVCPGWPLIAQPSSLLL